MNGAIAEWLLADDGSEVKMSFPRHFFLETSYTANRGPQVNLAECLAAP